MLASFLDRLAALPLIWHLLWIGLAVLSIGLIVLSRTKWGQSNPMRNCAVLSVLAHVLLFCLAATVRIASGPAGAAPTPPLQIALVSGSEAETSSHDDEQSIAQPWDAMRPGPIARPNISTLDRNVAEDAHELPVADPLIDASENIAPLPDAGIGNNEAAEGGDHSPHSAPRVASPAAAIAKAPQPQQLVREVKSPSLTQPELNRSELEKSTEITSLPAGALPIESELVDPHDTADKVHRDSHAPHSATDSSIARRSASPPAPIVTPSDGAVAERIDVPNPAVSPRIAASMPSAKPHVTSADPSLYRQRQSQQRARLVGQQGGSEETEAAVDRALLWLARAQSTDGRWDASHHGAGRERAVLGHDRRGAGTRADTGLTGLAVLAFLGAGHTHEEGSHQRTVQRGLDFLIRSQAESGDLSGDASLYARMYCHGMALFALGEALAMTGDRRLHHAVQRGVLFSVQSQHASGSWRYRPGDRGDTSQLGWQVMALRSAELAGVQVPQLIWQRAESYLRSVSHGQAGGLAAYQPGLGINHAMTAEAAYCKLLIGQRQSTQYLLFEMADEAGQYVMTSTPGSGQTNLYFWYYAALLLHSRQQNGDHAAEQWQRFNEALKTSLLVAQHRGGPLEGAFSADTMWGGYGGRVYSTALSTLCLEIYYRYLPILGGAAVDRTVKRRGSERIR